LKKAFDAIHSGNIIEIVKAYGVPENMLAAIKKLCQTESQNDVT
jgi:hypothetical protein